jgi:hypothetical protein
MFFLVKNLPEQCFSLFFSTSEQSTIIGYINRHIKNELAMVFVDEIGHAIQKRNCLEKVRKVSFSQVIVCGLSDE